MTTGQIVLVLAVVLALGFGAYRAAVDGRFRGTHRVRGSARAAHSTRATRSTPATDSTGAPAAGTHSAEADVADPHERSVLHGTGVDHPLGERATLLQFSSAFCAPCRATRRVLSEVAGLVPGVEHIEVDAEHHLDLVRALGVLRTPTTLILDSRGREVSRAAGTPRKEQVLGSVAAVHDMDGESTS